VREQVRTWARSYLAGNETERLFEIGDMNHTVQLKRLSRGARRVVFLLPVFILLVGILVAEFILLPLVEGMPRSSMLMGFCANGRTTKMVDDTPINEMGFTGDVLKKKKAPGTIRILTLGGSSMFNRRMTERLKVKLQAATPVPIEVLGAALREHTSQSSVYKYELLSPYNFDYVLLYDGINDLWANHVSEKDFREDYSQLNAFYNHNFPLSHSIIARVIYRRFIYHAPRRVLGGAGFRSIKVLERNIQTLVDRMRKDGAVPILMTFAWHIPDNYTLKAFREHTLGYNNPDRYEEWPVEGWGTVAHVKEGLRRTNESINSLAAREGILLIDQEALMRSKSQLYTDVCHFSDEGTDVFIDNIVNYFKAKRLLDTPSKSRGAGG
jgi:hypothetical protein